MCIKFALKCLGRAPRGFTLLELIIVIIIIGVIASLALPRMSAMVETARATEAINTYAQIRGAVERCYVMHSQIGYCPCIMPIMGGGGWKTIGMDNPSQGVGAHFTYSASDCTTTGYTIGANRNSYDGGSAGMGFITFIYSLSGVDIQGTGAYSGLP